MTLHCCCKRSRVSINQKKKKEEINCLHLLDEYLKVVVKRRQKTPAFLDLAAAWENISTKVIQEGTPECPCTTLRGKSNIDLSLLLNTV